MDQIERLKQEFPEFEVTPLSNHGANLHTKKGFVTIYWIRKRKYCINGEWHQYDTFEGLLIKLAAFFHVPKKDAPKAMETLVHENKVQDVIDHINRKVENMQKNGGSNSVIAMLKSLSDELKQYL